MTKKYLVIPAIIFLFALTVAPAFADGNDIVNNENNAFIGNMIEVEAETGENMADGSYGGSGGDGGSIYNNYRQRYDGPVLKDSQENNNEGEGGDIDESATGNGGNGGNASDGGTVVTGDAAASLRLEVWANRNLTEIDRCACDEGTSELVNDDGNSRVRNLNSAMIMNGGESEAETGENEALGSYAGAGGEGGDIKNNGDDVDEVMTGNGATGGNAALGGLVQTGRSDAVAEVVNRINENVTRIRR